MIHLFCPVPSWLSSHVPSPRSLTILSSKLHASFHHLFSASFLSLPLFSSIPDFFLSKRKSVGFCQGRASWVIAECARLCVNMYELHIIVIHPCISCCTCPQPIMCVLPFVLSLCVCVCVWVIARLADRQESWLADSPQTSDEAFCQSTFTRSGSPHFLWHTHTHTYRTHIQKGEHANTHGQMVKYTHMHSENINHCQS